MFRTARTPRTPHSIDDYLADGKGAGGLLAHAASLQKLARIHASVLPEHLARASRVANHTSGTVVIHAENGAVAVKLRQMAPTLTREFLNRGFECSDVRIKVQAFDISDHSRDPPQRPLSTVASDELARLAAGMAESPLRAAIETLLARSARAE